MLSVFNGSWIIFPFLPRNTQQPYREFYEFVLFHFQFSPDPPWINWKLWQERKKKNVLKFCIINSYYCKNKINLDWKLVNNGASQLFEFERSAPYCLREQHGVFFRFIARLGNPPKQIFHIQKKKKNFQCKKILNVINIDFTSNPLKWNRGFSYLVKAPLRSS